MKATQIGLTLGLVAPVVAVVLGIGVHTAHAGCIAAGTYTVSSSNTSFKVGTATAKCTSTTASFTVDPPGPLCGDPLCIPLPPPKFAGCTVSSSGFNFAATLTANQTNGSWQICLKTDSTSSTGITGTLSIPQDGLKAVASVLGQTCTTTAARGGSATLAGPWSNAPTSSVTFTNQSVPVTTTGGFPCPSATTSTASGTYQVSPGITF